ncbi:MAG: hypothetical protein ABIQ93_12915 [Saprospiraceae bacterium]
MKRSTENWVIGVLAAACLIYIILRAWLLPITHDEGSTIINHVPRRLFDSLFYEREANLNNHILNTLAIKALLGIFPGNQFVVRLPVLVGGCLYLWAGLALCRRLSDHALIRLFGVVMLLGNPFLLEFFSLARGYGLALGLMMMALYQAWRFLENNKARTLRNAFIFAGLAVYANFTLLLFFMPFSLLLFWAAGQQNRAWAAFWPITRPAFYTFGIYLLLWITPVLRLSGGEDFSHWSQLSSNLESIRLLVDSSVHGHAYLGRNTSIILSWAALVFMFIGGGVAIGQWWRKNKRFAGHPSSFLAAVFLGAVLVNFLQTKLLHTADLNARVSLFFYPLFAFLLIQVADWLWTKWVRRSWAFMGPVLLLVLINNLRCLNLKQSFEWWFDAHTFQVLHKIRSIQAAEGRAEPYSFDASWIVLNSFSTHVNEFPQGYDRVLQHVEWHPNRSPVPGPDFYFALYEEEAAALGEGYQVVFKPRKGVLLRKK